MQSHEDLQDEVQRVQQRLLELQKQLDKHPASKPPPPVASVPHTSSPPAPARSELPSLAQIAPPQPAPASPASVRPVQTAPAPSPAPVAPPAPVQHPPVQSAPARPASVPVAPPAPAQHTSWQYAPASSAAPKKKTSKKTPPNRRKQLASFRRAFLRLTADGTFPPDRQNKLFQACQKVYLDWDEARQYVQPEALKVYQRYVTGIISRRALTEQDFKEIRKLQARLGLEDTAPAVPQIDTTITRVLWRRRSFFALPSLALLLLVVVSGIALGFGIAFALGLV